MVDQILQDGHMNKIEKLNCCSTNVMAQKANLKNRIYDKESPSQSMRTKCYEVAVNQG